MAQRISLKDYQRQLAERLRAEYEDEHGGRWSELDVGELVRDPEFLSVAM